MSDYLQVNRANWDDRVPIHASSKFYDVDAYVAHPPRPQPWETQFLGDVTGLNVVHLQCHIGTDTLALATAGATVTGVDFSGPAVAQARKLATAIGVADRATFVESDVYLAADVLPPVSFDLVYVSLGALCWLPSVGRWAEVVSALLRPGGRLYIHDVHPVAWALSQQGESFTLTYTYFEEAEPFVDEIDITYTDGDARLAHAKAYEWNHSIGEITNALIGSGMRIDSLDEHDWTVFELMPGMTRGQHSQWHLASGAPRIPLTFTLTATKP